jgi:hypothetical protein
LEGRESSFRTLTESETERSRLAREMTRLVAAVSGLVALFCVLGHCQAQQQPNYRAALTNSLLYFEGQRSGRLPPDQRVQWRGDSALADGRDHGVSGCKHAFPSSS